MFSDIGTGKVTEPPQKILYSNNNYLQLLYSDMPISKHSISELNSCTQNKLNVVSQYHRHCIRTVNAVQNLADHLKPIYALKQS